MIIREARAADRQTWMALWADYLAFYETDLAPEVSATTWSRLLDPNEPMFCLLAEYDGQVIGFVNCVLHRGTWAIGDFCYLEDLFVAQAARGLGAGRALIEAVYAEADRRGAERVYWLTHETNTTARRLYDKLARNLGFIQYRR
jgi:GNAT superfamily N-acetyltransferase